MRKNYHFFPWRKCSEKHFYEITTKKRSTHNSTSATKAYEFGISINETTNLVFFTHNFLRERKIFESFNSLLPYNIIKIKWLPAI